MHRGSRILALLVTILAIAAAAGGATAKTPPLRFGRPMLVDATHAGGEPTVVALPSGELLYAAHAQLTQYQHRQGVDPVAVTPFRGQSYLWRSADRGATWTPVAPPLSATGSSDPDFTLDAAGNVYLAEITPAQTAVARSSDGGRTWTATPVAAVVYDREWLAGGAPNEVFMSGKIGLDVMPGIFRSTDGGLTWTLQGTDYIGEYLINKLWYDGRRKVLYHPYTTGLFGDASHEVGISVSTDQGRTWVHRRSGSVGRTVDTTAPPIALGRDGAVYQASHSTDANGHTRMSLVMSRDGGASWSKPIRLSEGNGVLFTWLVAGDAGRVAAAWLCADRPVTDSERQTAAWSVCTAMVTGVGTAKPVVHRARVTPKPVHIGTVCLQGITCVPAGLDRRLGDFLTLAADLDGSLLVAYSETQTYPNSAVARPAFARQSSGPKLYLR